MGLTDSLKNTSGMWASDATVKIALGDGSTNIDIAARNAIIDVGNGNQTIDANVKGFLFADTGECGFDNINVAAGGNVIMNVHNGGSNIDLFAAEAAIIGGCGSQNLTATTLGDTLINFDGCACNEYNFDIAAQGNASVFVDDGDLNLELLAGNAGGSSYATVGISELDMCLAQGAGIVAGDGQHAIAAATENNLTMNLGDGLTAIDAQAVGNIGIKAGDGEKAIIADALGNVVIEGGDGEAYISVTAENASVTKGAGQLDFEAVTNSSTYLESGNGGANVDIMAGEVAQVRLGAGDANVNVTTFGDGLNIITTDSIASNTNNITAKVTGSAYVNTGYNSTDNVEVAAGGDAELHLGFGNSDVNVTAFNAIVDTDCGNQKIKADTVGDLVVKTGLCGEDTVDATVGGNAQIGTYGDNDKINLDVEGNFTVIAGTTDPEEESDNDTVYIKSNSKDGVNYVSAGDGKDQISIFADRTVVDKNNGEMLLGMLGNVAQINSKADKNTIGAYGDNYTFNLEVTANNDVRTLDFWLRDGQDGKKILMNDGSQMALKDMVDDVHGVDGYTLTEFDKKNNADALKFFKANFADAFDDTTHTEASTEIISQTIDITGMSKDEIANKYNLSDQERQILKDVDLTKTFGNTGAPLYSLALSPKKSKAAGKDVYVVVKTDSTTQNNYIHARAVSDNECIAFNVVGTTSGGAKAVASNVYGKIDTAVKAEDITGQQITTTKYAELANYTTFGVANWEINLNGEKPEGCGCGPKIEAGKLMVDISARGGYISLNGETFNTETKVTDINIVGGHRDSVKQRTWERTVEDWALSVFVQKNSWNSPLILDMNGDGKISSTTGIGVDIDGDGKADGAASDGDKMLAMSDMNNDGKIGGTEVFGNNTISPFTKQKLNAANGFEALRMIAEEAEAKGYKCMNGGEVDIAALAEALEKEAGVKLGFISGANAKTLEDITGVKSIDTNYIDTTLESGAQRQHGSFVREDGKLGLVDDVWFQNNK